MKTPRILTAATALATFILGPAYAEVVTLPTSPTGSYRLIFVTAGSTTATDNTLAYYDNFANAQANLNPTIASWGLTWHAVVATSTALNVAANIGPGNSAVVYNVVGQTVFTSTSTMLNYATNLVNPVRVNQNGVVNSGFDATHPWTGAWGSPTAVGDATSSLGNTLTFAARAGVITSTQSDWIQTEYFSTNRAHPIYAISDEVVVTPEPGSIGLLGPALGVLVLLRRRRRTAAAAGQQRR